MSASSPSATRSSKSGGGRILSMDQYRGYAVLGMFVVNFLGHMDATHHSLKHNDTHFNWADSIMPAFIFAAGFSFRLSVLKRIPRIGRWNTYRGIIKRSFALVLVSLIMYGFNGEIKHWADMNQEGIWRFVASTLKANIWEVLAIIGMCQLLILPFIEMSSKARLATVAGFSVLHVLLSASFNYAFVTGQVNWMDEMLGIVGKTAWDGGIFGLISWSVPMLAGTLAYDLMSSRDQREGMMALLKWGTALMLIAYLASCLTRLYDVRESNAVEVAHVFPEPEEEAPAEGEAEDDAEGGAEGAAEDEAGETEEETEEEKKQREAEEKKREEEKKKREAEEKFRKKMQERASAHAVSPVIPPLANIRNRPLTSLLAEPPFFAPPPSEERKLNYWMMTKRVSTQSFMLFATGFSCVVYALFILVCDIGKHSNGLFAMFGENPLAAYIIHYNVIKLVEQIVPEDSPWYWATFGLILFSLITWLCVRFLQKSKFFLRL